MADVDECPSLSRASSVLLGLNFNGLPTHSARVSDARWRRHRQLHDEALEAGTPSFKLFNEPTFPIYLKFTDVTYKVAMKGIASSKEKEILKGITGAVNPGEMVALMGPSGSGKTSLLNLLGGRLPPSAIGGSVSYNNQPYSKLLKSRIGFVTQDDVLFPHLTVKETLVYSALLRLSKSLSSEEKEKGALDVIKKLGLERCENTMIGGPFLKGISGGERKRVCIGNEILINPSILFLDEPTSGLDSTTAQRIVQILGDIAREGKTIVTTIHQPSSTLFHKFDKLILLGRGRLLYYGKARESMAYFSSIGCSPLIPMNPADFLLDLANGTINDITFPREESKPPSPSIVHEYLVDCHQAKVADPEEGTLLSEMPLEVKTSVERRSWGASWGKQYTILFVRGIKERKHEYFSWLRVVQVIAISIVLGLLWWRSDPKTSKDPRKQAGLLFFISVFWGFFPLFNAIFTFPQERAMLKKERSADMYRLSAYFAARTTSDLPLDLLLPVIFLVVVYFMTGLRLTATHFFLTMMIVFLCIIAAQGMGLAIGATMMNLKMATTFASVTVMTFMLAGGFFVKDVPVFVAWIRYLSFNYHTYKLLLMVQYDAAASQVNGAKLDNGVSEIAALLCMVFGYRFIAYFSLRRMKLQS